MTQNKRTSNSQDKLQENNAKPHNVNDTRLYTVREWWGTESGKGIMLKLSARDDDGNYRNVKAYIPLESDYEDATTGSIEEHNGCEVHAIIRVPKMREFAEKKDGGKPYFGPIDNDIPF